MDLQALQSPSYRARGVGRYAEQWALALEHARPDLVGRFLLNPGLPPPGDVEELLASGKLRYSDAPDAFPPSSRIFHSLAPLDTAVRLESLWPSAASRLLLSATVYDCIPALDPEHELADPAERSRYGVRLELLRAAAQLQVLSPSVAGDLGRVLGGGPAAVVVGAAPSGSFRPPRDREEAERRVRSGVTGLERPYVLYPTGSHPRKNNERLVEAWSLLPRDVTSSWQLVLAGDLPRSTTHHIAHVAERLGIADSVVTTGYVGDDLIVALYQAASLVCFPSLSEGFGLPVAEAIACHTPVVASDRPPISDLVPHDRRFDPERVEAIAAALAAALESSWVEAQGATRAPTVAVSSWADVAARAADAFDGLLGGARRPLPRRRRRRLAFVTPLPPAPTGVANYSYRLLEELAATGEVDLDAFADGPTPGQEAPDGIAVYRARSLEAVERLRGGYDRVVYALGNSHHHLGALALLRRRAGVVVAHDVRLTNLYRHEHGDPGLRPGGLGRAVQAMYGDGLPATLGADGDLSVEDVARYGVLMAREVVAGSERFLASSRPAAALAALEVGTGLARRLGVLPFAIEVPNGRHATFADEMAPPPPSLGPAMRATWGRGADAVAPRRPVVAHFGIVDPVKEPELLLDAFAIVRHAATTSPAPVLAYVGPIGDELADRLVRHADELDLAEDVILTGPLGAHAYTSWLALATIAVQLRRSSNGEASAAVGDCLASGTATVASDLGWVRELPDDALVKVPASIADSSLATVMAQLLADAPRRDALGRAARAEADRRSFARTARHLLEITALDCAPGIDCAPGMQP
ncbi:MAG: hypothetical protein JWO62_881 [Acidimicrobiaceae bacterium]|nr:hypothetical protein [Acidimicrobiaceae bacterium]